MFHRKKRIYRKERGERKGILVCLAKTRKRKKYQIHRNITHYEWYGDNTDHREKTLAHG